ncbi:MAG: hypothetical protein ABI806_15805 [Candidatus Solibacter sp.]
MAGTEDAGNPFFSPDGKWIGFEKGCQLTKIAVAGGAAIPLCDASVLRGAGWGDDDNIVFGVRSSVLWRVPAGGGTAQPIAKVTADQRNHRWPQVLPGSRTVLLSSSQSNNFDNADSEAPPGKAPESRCTYRLAGEFGEVAAAAAARRLSDAAHFFRWQTPGLCGREQWRLRHLGERYRARHGLPAHLSEGQQRISNLDAG